MATDTIKWLDPQTLPERPKHRRLIEKLVNSYIEAWAKCGEDYSRASVLVLIAMGGLIVGEELIRVRGDYMEQAKKMLWEDINAQVGFE